MAIKVSGTTVISNNREVSSVNGFKTVGGESILGSGDIATGGAAPSWQSSNSGTEVSVNSGNTLVSGSSNTGRFFHGRLTNAQNQTTLIFGVNGSNSWMNITGVHYKQNTEANLSTYDEHLTSNNTATVYVNNNTGNKSIAMIVRGYLGAGGNVTRNSGANMRAYYKYWNE